MAADMHIHIFEGITEDDLAVFFANTMASKYFRPGNLGERWQVSYAKISDTPNVWVGEVSWLKAALFEDDTFIPDPISKISEIIGEDLLVIDDALIGRISRALTLPNETVYHLAQAEKIISFLTDNKGERAFTVSW